MAVGLKKALEKLNSAIDDLTSLHVQTLSGELDLKIDSNKEFKTLKSEIEKAKVDGKVLLIAETLSQFDGDSYNFVRKDAEEVSSIALEVHKNAVKAGIETRLGLLGLFKSILNK